jgi:hypothetical protein
MLPETDLSDVDIKKRFSRFYGEDRVFADEQIPHFREKWSNL